ncbi:lytic transglycosylase domain-containing protein [Nonomuraea roseola]|uniref:Lytic transglycosylase domain-containing protein n=1 Tax=Nonomuraea roseola TaxID=46179 RepID=A0ABV5PTR3_9ACTN
MRTVVPIALAIVLFSALLPLIVLLASTEAVSAMLPTSRSIGQGEDPIDVEDIPPEMLRLYVAATRTCPGLHWSAPAAVGKIESDHGRSSLPGVKSGTNSAGAAGPMQFLISTWGGAVKIKAGTLLNGYAADGDDDGWADVYNPADAIYGAVKYLCASGAPSDARQALHAYNHSWAYVEDVLAQAERYRQVATTKPQARQAFAPEQQGGGDMLTPRTRRIRDLIKQQFGVPTASAVTERSKTEESIPEAAPATSCCRLKAGCPPPASWPAATRLPHGRKPTPTPWASCTSSGDSESGTQAWPTRVGGL